MKKAVALVLASLMMGAAATGCSSPGGTSSAAANNGTASAAQSAAESTVAASDVSVGVCIYKFDDTFMTGVRTNMQTQAKSLGVNLDIVDSQNKQPTQNEQVDTFITKGVSALAVNPVDRTAAESILKKAKDKNLPIVFLNREPEANVMKEYDKVWYVGAKVTGVQTCALPISPSIPSTRLRPRGSKLKSSPPTPLTGTKRRPPT